MSCPKCWPPMWPHRVGPPFKVSHDLTPTRTTVPPMHACMHALPMCLTGSSDSPPCVRACMLASHALDWYHYAQNTCMHAYLPPCAGLDLVIPPMRACMHACLPRFGLVPLRPCCMHACILAPMRWTGSSEMSPNICGRTFGKEKVLLGE